MKAADESSRDERTMSGTTHHRPIRDKLVGIHVNEVEFVFINVADMLDHIADKQFDLARSRGRDPKGAFTIRVGVE